MPKFKNLKQLVPASVHTVAASPLESESPHRKLARLNAELIKTTEQIQAHSKAWADKNIRAQATRVAIATSEITAYKNEHRDLASNLLSIQTEIAGINKDLRARKAERQLRSQKNHDDNLLGTNGSARRVKTCPAKDDPRWDSFFRLAAENQLAPGILKSIEAEAKGLLAQALGTGIE